MRISHPSMHKKSPEHTVPTWSSRFLRWYCPDYLLESIEGDLEEQFEQDVIKLGLRKARLQYTKNVCLFFRPGIILRNKFSLQLLNLMMLQNYWKVAVRNIARRKLYAFINAFGLSIAIACCVLIYLYVIDELSFDQFHENKDRIVRIHHTSFDEEKFKEGDPSPYNTSAWLPGVLADVMQDELAEVEYVTRFNGGTEGVMQREDKIFKQATAFVDSGFFKMFSFRVLKGSIHKIFRNTNEAVLTPAVAEKFFGNEDPIGKTFSFFINEKAEYLVVAVIEAPPANSSIEFEMILPSIHLSPQISWYRVSDSKYSWILGGIGLLILIIACINYIVLSLATSNSRKTEIGVRKVVGAKPGQLINQFSFESILLAFIAMFIGIVLVISLLPVFNEYTAKSIVLTFDNMSTVIAVILVLTIAIGLTAGFYPAFVLSSFKPVTILKGKNSAKLQTPFAKAMVVLQFTLSTLLIVSSVIMYRQMEYITTKDLGYDAEKVIAIETNAGWNKTSDEMVPLFRNALSQERDVLAVAGTSASFNKGWSRYGWQVDGENKWSYVFRVDEAYLDLLGIKLLEGRNFDNVADSSAVIVNEAFVKDMGWTDPLSEYVNWQEDTVGKGSPVIGDFGRLTTILVKLGPGETPDQLSKLEQKWKQTFPDKPFEYSFVDEDVARQYQSHDRWMKIMGIATCFAIVISCLGLFGLAGIESLNRVKEVGIRKVMGASLFQLMVLLNRKYIMLALIAFVIAAPISWWMMTQWLAAFKYRITLSWELFGITLLTGLAIALITVSYHALKAARSNPAETLKYE
ncbi:MAG: ABC transporter permease [Cytophagia bacterium]|nr:ABC transporter permease [Cytophagia bacterium]